MPMSRCPRGVPIAEPTQAIMRHPPARARKSNTTATVTRSILHLLSFIIQPQRGPAITKARHDSRGSC